MRSRPDDLKGRSDKVLRLLKFEEELDLGFGEDVASKAYGQKLLSCIQCGTCSATCPLSHYMIYTPRRVIAMVREGFRDEALSCTTIWLCASCYACTVQCPRNIHITDVMYTLKREAIARGKHPPRYAIPVLARNFFKGVLSSGRSSEGRLLVKLYLQTNPLNALKQAGVALRLLVMGRLSMKRERIENTPQLRKLLDSVEARKAGAR